jgi:hypothetical protein
MVDKIFRAEPVSIATTAMGLAITYQGAEPIQGGRDAVQGACSTSTSGRWRRTIRAGRERSSGSPSSYRSDGQLSRSGEMYMKALAILQKALGTEHRDLVEPLMGLALLGVTSGQSGQAERLFYRIITIQEKALGPQHCELGRTLQGIGPLLRIDGNEEQPETYEKRAQDIMAKCGG